MAFLHKDARGYFYICESKRTGGRVVRKKLAYLGRMIVPDVMDSLPIVRNGEYRRLTNLRSSVVRGEVKPTLELARIYCRVVSDIPATYTRDSKIVERAARGMKIMQRCGKAADK